MTSTEKRAAYDLAVVQLEASRREEEHWRKRTRELEDLVDEKARAFRPTMPTPLQKLAIEEVCQKVFTGEKWGDHLGSRVGPKQLTRGHVSYCSAARRIGVDDGSLWSARIGRGHLWSFTDVEVAIVLAYIEDQGLTVTDHWRHGDGISVIVADPNEKEA